jgi:hypothetical protein
MISMKKYCRQSPTPNEKFIYSYYNIFSNFYVFLLHLGFLVLIDGIFSFAGISHVSLGLGKGVLKELKKKIGKNSST